MKTLMIACLLGFLTQYANAQTANKCGTAEHLELQKLQDPTLESRMAANEILLQQYMSTARTTTAPTVIRVVVHVVWNTAVQNISNAQVLSQIDVLNEDFMRANADTNNTPAAFEPFAASANIYFCLATEDPNGNPTDGIVRVQTAIASFSNNDNVKFTATGGSDAWDPNSYLNLWVCNLTGGLLGYAQYPGGALPTEGAVFKYNAFGRVGTLQPPYDLGRNAVHELGHFFNLRHIWGDAQCGNDFVADTPTQNDGNFSCPSFPQVSCSNGPNGDMFMNYMDYSDDACLNMFTAGQAARMNAAIAMFYPGLISNMDCIPYLKKLSGRVFYDTNQNGVSDTGEPGMINRDVMLFPDSIIMTSNSAGAYQAWIDSGAYTVTLQPDPIWNTSGPASYNVIVDSVTVCCNDFGLIPVTIFDDVSLSFIAGQFRCGFEVPGWIQLINTGTSIISGSIRFIPDNLMTYVSALPAPDVMSGDTLYFNYSNLYPGQSVNICLIYEMPLTPGIELCVNTLASIFDGTTNQPFTENLYCDTITCSFDPNDKRVVPPGVLAAHYILKTDTLSYTIRFQNEGTDTAFTVVLRDQLSNLLDRNTIELVASSHPVTLTITTSNLAEFRFDDILLPQKAVNETGSNGYVTFRIRPFPGLPDGTIINNNAGIYFDYNPPVITNTTFVTLVTTIPLGIAEVTDPVSINITPHPFTNQCEIILTSENTAPHKYELYDIAGRKVKEGITPSGKRKMIHLNTESWSQGLYTIRFTDEKGVVVQTSKLVKH